MINKWYVVSAAQCDDHDDEVVEEVRLGEWKVKDVDKFDQRNCKYSNEDQKQDCERHQLCGTNCIYENPLSDCETCPELQDIKVATVRKHPNFRKTKDGIPVDDIMLIKLSKPAVYNRLVKPVCLPPPDFDNLLGEERHTPGYFKHKNVVVGWGKTNNTQYYYYNSVASYQQKLTTPLLSNDECIEQFKRLVPEVSVEILLEEYLCAGGVQEEDSCSGDSGGPLIGREQPADPFILIGVVSLGTKPCALGAPTVYTRVSHYRSWIINHMS